MSSVWDIEPLVDLGEDFDAPMPAGFRAGSGWSVLRRFRFAVPVCALLFLVTAATPAPAAPLRLAARIPIGLDASAMVEGSSLYLYDISGGHDSIRAYSLDDGGLRWSAATTELAPETTMQYTGGRVIVSMVDTDSGGEHTVAFDPSSGARLWTSDLGFAAAAAGGVLVESAPRPPGFNYPGTVATGTFQLLESRTGRARWTVRVPDNCVTEAAGPTADSETVLVELCANASRLTIIDLTDGHVTATRHVNLGDPANNFVLPPADQMDEPQLVVAGGTILVAHANAPTPTIDAYAMEDLHQLWTGLPVVEGQDVNQCGTTLCIFDGASSGSVIDLRTGRELGLVPPRGAAAPEYGSLVLAPVGQVIDPSAVSVVQSAGAGAGMLLAPPRDPVHSTVLAPTAMWLAAWHVVVPRRGALATGGIAPIEILHGVGSDSCIELAAYVVCTTAPDRITVWRLR